MEDALEGIWPYIISASALYELQGQEEVTQFSCWQHNYTDLPWEMEQERVNKQATTYLKISFHLVSWITNHFDLK